MINNELQESINNEINFSGSELYFVKKHAIPEPIVVEPHFHKWLEIVYYYNGKGGEVRINANTYTYKAGQSVVVKPYALHSFRTFSSQDIIILGISCSVLLDLFLNSCLEKEITRFIELFYHLPPICRGIEHEVIRSIEKIEGLSRLSAIGLILQLYDFFLHYKSGALSSPIDSKFFKAIFYMENNFYKKLTIQDVADKIGMSRFYFSRKFKEYFHISFPGFINKIRLDKSRFLLLNSHFTISEIVYKMGFQEVSYFNKLFKQAYNVTPSEFRNNMKKMER